jgi:serine/threonine protein kinase
LYEEVDFSTASHLSEEVKNLISSMMHKTPNHRLPVDEAIHHDFFTMSTIPKSLPKYIVKEPPRKDFI